MTNIPHLFRCPISLDLFMDPVTLSTGQTYDRQSIERWLAAGNLTCPVTMQRLQDPTLVPNRTLRHLIDQWILSGTEHNPNQDSSSPPTNTSESSLATLKRNLQLEGAIFESSLSSIKMETFKKIRILSVESDTGRQCLIQLGFFPLLLDLLFRSPQVLEPEVMEVALDCALNLSPSTQLDSLSVLKESSNLSSMIDLLNHKNTQIKAGLCSLIEVATSAEDISNEIGRRGLIFRMLIPLLSSHTTESEASVRALSSLCSFETNRHIAVREGTVDGLVGYLSFPGRRNVGRALATLEALVETDAGRMAVVRNPAGVKILVKMVFRISAKDDGGSEHAVGALLVVCGGEKVARVEAVNVGVLSQLLLLLQSQCGLKAKAKARALLKLLSSAWE